MRNILFTIILTSMSCLIFANPIDMVPLKVIQPNGDSITIIPKGDEYGIWYETLEGYVIKKNASNYWVYVNTNTIGELVLTNQIVSNVSSPIGINVTNVFNTITSNRINAYNIFNNDSVFNPDLEDVETLMALNQGNTYSVEQARVSAKNKGKINVLTILIQFQDVKFQSPSTVKNFFSNLMNKSNFTHPSNQNIATGCVREYWEEVSYGQLSINPIVIGPYTAEHTIDYYSATMDEDYSLKTFKTRKLVREAIKKAAKEGDMRYFDNDNNGFVDFVHVVFAGSNDDIWPHQSNILSILRDGVWVSKYIITPEIEDNRYASIGTICHEMGHAFGAPDFYDRNYELEGLFYGTGKWDLMAYGDYNKNDEGFGYLKID
jgi:M6 family metalloprotease-like protein